MSTETKIPTLLEWFEERTEKMKAEANDPKLYSGTRVRSGAEATALESAATVLEHLVIDWLDSEAAGAHLEEE